MESPRLLVRKGVSLKADDEEERRSKTQRTKQRTPTRKMNQPKHVENVQWCSLPWVGKYQLVATVVQLGTMRTVNINTKQFDVLKAIPNSR